MAFRIIFMLVCLVAFINGCSSLVSQRFGSHKLQVVDMAAVRTDGLGATDFIQLSDAQITGDFIFAPGKTENDRTVVLYPLVDAAQMDSLRQGQKVFVNLIGWENRRPGSEADTVSIATVPELYRGLIRKPGKRFEKVTALDSTRYGIANEVTYLAIGKQPLEWQWNVLIMGIAFAIFLLLGRRLRK